jgi:hypothetical protein
VSRSAKGMKFKEIFDGLECMGFPPSEQTGQPSVGSGPVSEDAVKRAKKQCRLHNLVPCSWSRRLIQPLAQLICCIDARTSEM